MTDGRCIACRRDGLLFDMQWAEPKSEDNAMPILLRGWICSDCAVVHWAQSVAEPHEIQTVTSTEAF